MAGEKMQFQAKIVWLMGKLLNCTHGSQSECKDLLWFQNECNKNYDEAKSKWVAYKIIH